MTTLRLEESLDESPGHDGEVLSCAYMPDGNCLISGGWDGNLCIWDAMQGVVVEKIDVGDKPVSACAVSPKNEFWLAGTMDGMLSQWDATIQKQMSVFLAHTRPISGLVYSPDGKYIASASWDRSISIWETERQQEGETLGQHADIVSGCRYTPDGKTILTWGYDGAAYMWHPQTKEALARLSGHRDRITSGDVAPDGGWLLTGGRDGEIKLWDLGNGQEVMSVPLAGEIRACCFLRDAESVAAVSSQGRVTLHRVPQLEIMDELTLRQMVQTAALSHSGGQLAVGCDDGRVRFVALDGFDSNPLAVTVAQSYRESTTFLQRMLGKRRTLAVFHCVCPACRAEFELPNGKKNESTSCPQCRRMVRICAVTQAIEEEEEEEAAVS